MKLRRLPALLHPLPGRLDRKIADGFYATPEWKQARQMSIAMHAYACAKCGRRGCRLYVDHIKELADGGAPYEQSNLEPLCGSCHNAKTHRARMQRLTG